jgi:hypothetical protein
MGMITGIKLLGKNVLRSLNSLTGRLLPVADLRLSTNNYGLKKINLTSPATIQGEFTGYQYDKKNVSFYWVDIFKCGVKMPAFFMLKLPGAYMVGRGVIIFNSKVILESTIFQREYLDKLMVNHIVLRSLNKTTGIKLGNVIPLLNKLSNNYYHWTTESLTRLAMFSEYSGEDYRNYDIVIAADSPAFVKESLINLFHVPANRIITWQNTDTGSMQNCVLLSYPFVRDKETKMTNIYNPSLYSTLNAISLKNIPANANGPEYIIISRANAIQRKLLGEEKIIEAFASLPFRVIYMEQMNFAEQVQLFRHAKVIIAVHGAGLVNLIYSTKKPVVIEIFPSTRKMRDAVLFHQIAWEMNLDYHLLVREPVNNDQDIEVTDALISEIKNILTSAGHQPVA